MHFIICLSLHYHCIIIALSLHYHCIIIALSLHYHCIIIALSFVYLCVCLTLFCGLCCIILMSHSLFRRAVDGAVEQEGLCLIDFFYLLRWANIQDTRRANGRECQLCHCYSLHLLLGPKKSPGNRQFNQVQLLVGSISGYGFPWFPSARACSKVLKRE